MLQLIMPAERKTMVFAGSRGPVHQHRAPNDVSEIAQTPTQTPASLIDSVQEREQKLRDIMASADQHAAQPFDLHITRFRFIQGSGLRAFKSDILA